MGPLRAFILGNAVPAPTTLFASLEICLRLDGEFLSRFESKGNDIFKKISHNSETQNKISVRERLYILRNTGERTLSSRREKIYHGVSR